MRSYVNGVCYVHQAFAQQTSFINTKLRGARFYKASLKEADFTGADLTGASLENASLDGAIFKDAVLQVCSPQHMPCNGMKG